MNLRERVDTERNLRTNGSGFTSRSIGRSPGSWLASYPVFQQALGSGETTFQALPEYARRVALLRIPLDDSQQAQAVQTLDNLRVSFVELCTSSVSEIVEDYLGRAKGSETSAAADASSLSASLGEYIPATSYPRIARPPCLLRPGHHLFSDGWMRFFAYRSRGDFTIPLLAIDWLDFHARIEGLLRDCEQELR